ncbi:hypothetical protein SAMN04488030_1930 [Aliiroseovarius halocynthiae]|uniref:Uncharacterized protein n=1 Tax=Aliiroseovarius halocynthiae TaxID=985055 RepID=A0A545SR48_9RHOB|nr:hypothetical protein [Aliiroseovarius halocynthiae]TQV67455.1 hypothetical protein FIL88_09525 [Aliiroseovarius halocynthiae]SMR81463.1 hypothetical protein SAMN04488030_1930 [Aliiroseovarius halocynthiae]
MTALTKYERLEATALWRPDDGAQRVDVLLSLGDATLTISDMRENVLNHWSLPAIQRLNPGDRPALFRPGEDATEELELEDDDMIRALEKVRKLVERRRPHPGRLRHWVTAGILLFLLALTVFWLPGALRSYTVSVVPEPSRAAIGQQILTRIGRITGQECRGRGGRMVLTRFARRVTENPDLRVVVLSGGVQSSKHLPGNITLLNRALIEDFEHPDVLAGFLLAEELRRNSTDPLLPVLDHIGLRGTVQLLTTGDLPGAAIDQYAEALLVAPQSELPPTALLSRFEAQNISATPYAYALDLTGETSLDLIEADPVSSTTANPLLSDDDWVRLQGVCGE